MLTEYLVQAYAIAYLVFLGYPAVAQPPLMYISTFFLIQNPMFLLIVVMFVVMFKDFEREIGTGHFTTIYILGAIAGNLGLLSVYFGTESLIPISGASAGVFCAFGAYIARHPWDLTVTEGLPMVTIMSLVMLTLGHIILFGKMDFLPIIIGTVYGYWLPPNPNMPRRPPVPQRRY
ncbi:MAG: rhomboid family intramembrane serine protease [Candidatus Micrarchaeota archaeon]